MLTGRAFEEEEEDDEEGTPAVANMVAPRPTKARSSAFLSRASKTSKGLRRAVTALEPTAISYIPQPPDASATARRDPVGSKRKRVTAEDDSPDKDPTGCGAPNDQSSREPSGDPETKTGNNGCAARACAPSDADVPPDCPPPGDSGV